MCIRTFLTLIFEFNDRLWKTTHIVRCPSNMRLLHCFLLHKTRTTSKSEMLLKFLFPFFSQCELHLQLVPSRKCKTKVYRKKKHYLKRWTKQKRYTFSTNSRGNELYNIYPLLVYYSDINRYVIWEVGCKISCKVSLKYYY